MATHLSENDPRWADAWVRLQAAVDNPGVENVRAATKEWTQCAKACARSRHDAGRPCADVWAEMHEFMKACTRMTAATGVANAMDRARECVTAMCDAMHEVLVNPLGDTNDYFRWGDAIGDPDSEMFCMMPLEGDAKSTLYLLLTRLECYGLYGDAWDRIWPFVTSTSVDTTPRMLERALTLFAGCAEFACINSDWHFIAENAGGPDGSGCDDADDLLERLLNPPDDLGYSLSSDRGLDDGAARDMFNAMRVARDEGGKAVPPLSGDTLDTLTYSAAQVFIQNAKRVYYKGLWRKWFVLWTTTNSWTKQVGEHQGGPLGAIGLQLREEFDVDMGDASRSP